ncbi:MAG TPA: PEGA domain-containing protein, partial [Thermotogota bacterium]|nr:PEGA domain-containing protein [Thermotogota bacterium]
PVDRMSVASGSHIVKIFRENYAPLEFSFELLPGEHKYFSQSLQPMLQPARLAIDPQPAEASVWVDGSLLGQGRKVLDGLKPGEYTVKVSLEGYRTSEQKVRLASGETRSLPVILDRLTGVVSIQVTPRNARVKIADRWFEPVSGIVRTELVIGSYPLHVEAQGYNSVETVLNVTAGTNPVVPVVLVPRKATLTLLSDPSEATVFIGNFARGKTPLVLELDSGTYQIKLEKSDFRVLEQSVTLLPGEEKEMTVVLESLLGYLHVSQPDGISIYVDGMFRGWAPDTIPLREGQYLVTLKDKGQERFRQQVTIVAGETVSISATSGM